MCRTSSKTAGSNQSVEIYLLSFVAYFLNLPGIPEYKYWHWCRYRRRCIETNSFGRRYWDNQQNVCSSANL